MKYDIEYAVLHSRCIRAFSSEPRSVTMHVKKPKMLAICFQVCEEEGYKAAAVNTCQRGQAGRGLQL